MAEANGEAALPDPDELVQEIERTRENLAPTLDTLTQRVSPRTMASAARTRAVRQRPAASITKITIQATFAKTDATGLAGDRHRPRHPAPERTFCAHGVAYTYCSTRHP